jgi:hypothetical protein
MNMNYISPHKLIITHCLLSTLKQKVLWSPPLQIKGFGYMLCCLFHMVRSKQVMNPNFIGRSLPPPVINSLAWFCLVFLGQQNNAVITKFCQYYAPSGSDSHYKLRYKTWQCSGFIIFTGWVTLSTQLFCIGQHVWWKFGCTSGNWTKEPDISDMKI